MAILKNILSPVLGPVLVDLSRRGGGLTYPFSFIDNCDSLLGGLWQLNNNTGNATIEVDGTDYVQGSGSIHAHLQRGDKLKRVFSTAADFSKDSLIRVKIDTLTNQLQFRVFFYDGTDYFYRYYSISDPHILEEDEWFTLYIDKTDITNVSGSPSWDNITQLLFYPIMDEAYPSQAIELRIDDMRSYDQDVSGSITFRFDDSLDEHYEAAELLHSYGYAGIEAVMTDSVGGSNLLTLAELTQMQAWGWDICSHYLDNTDLTSIPIATATAGIITSKDYLVTNGFSKGARFFIYPQGEFNDELEAVVKQYHVMTGVSANSTAYRFYSDFNEFRLGYYEPSDIADAQTLIDAAVTNKYHLVFGFHALTDLTLLTAICEYLSTNGVRVITYSKLYDYYRNGEAEEKT